MVKDIRYIIKRFIVGVLIFLAIYFLKNYLLIGVYAQEISSYTWGYHGDNINDDSSNYAFTINSNPWANWRTGYLYFTFSINSVSPATNDPISVRSVVASSDTVNYICNVGSSNNTGGSYNSTTYSAKCPMDLGWPGLTGITVNFNVVNSGTNALYHIEFSSQATFEQTSSVTLSTTDTTNAINNQITNDNTNTTNIINNQNTNTEKEIESQKVCNIILIDKTSIVSDGHYLNSNGNIDIASAPNYGVTDFISVHNASIRIITIGTNGVYSCFYDSSKTKISCINTNGLESISVPDNAYYFRSSINKLLNKPTFEIESCKNGNQAIADSQQQINNTLNDSTGVSDNDITGLFEGIESSDTPISDLITMPITFLQAFISGFEGTCQSISLGQLYGEYLIIPCINIGNIIGSELLNTIDILISMFLIFEFGRLIISAFESITSLEDDFSWLFGVEGGRHAGPGNTRIERNSGLY